MSMDPVLAERRRELAVEFALRRLAQQTCTVDLIPLAKDIEAFLRGDPS